MTHLERMAQEIRNCIERGAALQQATLAARARLDDPSIATHVNAGKLQVVRVTYRPSGRSDVTPVSEWLSVEDTVAFLEGMQS